MVISLLLCQNCKANYQEINPYFEINGIFIQLKCNCSVSKTKIEDFLQNFEKKHETAFFDNNNFFFCKLHGEKIIGFCKDCHLDICQKCIDNHHKCSQEGKIIRNLGNMYKELKEKVIQNFSVIKNKNVEAIEKNYDYGKKLIEQNQSLSRFKSVLDRAYNNWKKKNKLLISFAEILIEIFSELEESPLGSVLMNIASVLEISEDDIKINKDKSIFEQFSQIYKNIFNSYIIRGKFSENKYSVREKKSLHTSSVDVLIQLEDGRLTSGSDDCTIKFWDIISFNCLKTLVGHKEGVYSITQLNSSEIASGSADSEIKVWNVITYENVATILGHTDCIWCFMPFMDNIVSVSEDQTIRVWNPNTFETEKVLKMPSGVKLLSSEILLDGRLIAGCSNGSMKYWNEKYQEGEIVGHTKGVNYILQLEDNRFASASADKTIRIWDIITLQTLSVLEGHDDSVETLMQLTNFKLASGSWDKTIRIWDINNGYNCCDCFVGHNGMIFTMVLLNNGEFASGGADNSIIVWKSEEKLS